MDYDREVRALAAETLALSAIIGAVCDRIARSSPEGREIIQAAFDDAAYFVEHVALVFGPTASPEQTLAALKVTEQIRAIALPGNEAP